MPEDPFISQLAQCIAVAWAAAGVTLGLFNWVTVAVLLAFVIARVVQIRDPHFDLRVTTPTTHTLHFLCAGICGLLLPAFYFLSVRTRHELGMWHLGTDTNTRWTLLLGVACMAWLAFHLIEPMCRLGAPRFGPSGVNRLFAAAGLGLCLWFHVKTIGAAMARPCLMLAESAVPATEPVRTFVVWLLGFAYPQMAFLGATLVFGFALAETLCSRSAPPPPRRWLPASALSAVLILTLFSPFWLSIPRTPHRQALALLTEHRARIRETARVFGLDPRLLAGIIYVAHTRDHPRWTGDVIERLGIELWEEYLGPPFGGPMINPSVGLAQIRTTTLIEAFMIGEKSVGGTPMFWYWNRMSEFAAFQGEHANRFTAPPISSKAQSLVSSLTNVLYTNRPVDLTNPDVNLAAAAFVLAIYRHQWSQAGHPIAGRPEILATLYNIGFERSYPKSDPRPNDFGRRVLAFMQTPECERLFGVTAPEASP